MYWLLIFTQGVIPLGLLLWQGLTKSRSRLSWVLKTMLVAIALGLISLTGLWSVLFPWWMPSLFWGMWAIFVAGTLGDATKMPCWPKRKIGPLSRVVAYGVLIGLLGSLSLQAITGLFAPAIAPVSLAFPLKNGTYHILNGGNHPLVNAHLKTLEAQYREYRGQSYGVDIVKLNSKGVRASGLLPKDIEAYEIYNEMVFAPCEGQVIALEERRPDMIPPRPDREYILGNHVLLRCDTADVLLAHFQQGGVWVKLEETVVTGQPLGKIGNSGNTNEPHLHIHAQRPGHQQTPIDGEPLPILFGDRYLVRNSRMTVQSPTRISF